MKALAVTLLAAWTVLSAGAAELEWMTDLAKAKTQAKAEKKMVLMDFTGSDWCPPCMILEKNVFSTPEFGAFAKDNLVLVRVDFPRKKKLAPELQKANEELAKQFGVTVFPTVVVLNSEGKQISKEEAYQRTGAKEYIANLQKLKGK
jgi:protein disulfide-isomerase